MKKLCLTVFCLFLAACVGTSRPVQFYSFKVLEPGAVEPLSRRQISVLVSEVMLPATLDRPQIVTGSPDSVELTISEMHRWSESLSTLMQRTIAADMGAYLPQAVIRPANYSRENFPYKIVVEVSRFEGNFNKDALLNADWRILGADRRLLKRGQTNLSQPVGQTYQDLVVAEGELIAELSRQIASALAGLK